MKQLGIFKTKAPAPGGERPEYALTLWQPWASAITVGPKRIENRPWPAPKPVIGRRIWIHAGTTYEKGAHAFVLERWQTMPTPLPKSALIGSARVVACVREDGAVVGGRLRVSTQQVLADSWWMGPYGWVLEDVEALDTPIPCRGFQRLWRPKPEVFEQGDRS